MKRLLEPFITAELTKFFDTAYERQSIFVKKQQGLPKPWTNDPIMQQGFFCNVFREQDKTTQWLIANVYHPYANRPNLWQSVLLCRYISYIPTLDEIYATKGYDIVKKAAGIFASRMLAGKHVRTPAFKVNDVTDVELGSSRQFYILRLIKHIEKLNWHWKPKTLRELYTWLMTLPGVDSFLAFQYCMDFTLTPYLSTAPDKNTWAAYGRGSAKGLARLLTGAPIVEEYMRIDFPMYAAKLIVLWQTDGRIGFIRAADVEHWLCEYDKYCDDWAKRSYL